MAGPPRRMTRGVMRGPLALVLVAALLSAAASGLSSPLRRRPQTGGLSQRRGLSSSRSINSELNLNPPSAANIMRVYGERPGEFDDVNLSTAWNRMGKSFGTMSASERRAFFGRHQDSLLQLLQETNPVVSRLLPRNLAGVAYGLARIGFRQANPTMDQIARVATKRLHEFKPQELSNIVWAFAKSGIDAPELFAGVGREAEPRLAEFKPQEIANTAWAFARAGAMDARFFASAAKYATTQLHLFKSQEIVNLAWAFATLRIRAPDLFEQIEVEATARLAEFNPQELGNLAWAFAKAEQKAPRLFEAIAFEAAPRLHEFKTQELSNTAWAFATVNAKEGFCTALFEAIAAEAVPRMSHFKTQELANTAWAFATAGVEAPALFDALAAEAVQQLDLFREQEVANTVWAYATACVAAPDLFSAVQREFCRRPDAFNTQELTMVAWAIVKRVTPAEGVFATICKSACTRAHEFSPQGMANLAWAFASAGEPSAKELIAAFEQQLVGKGVARADAVLSTFKAQEVANLIWACATSGAHARTLFEAVARVMPPRVVDFEPQDVANTAWAYTVTEQIRPALATALAAKALDFSAEVFGQEACCQMHQFNMALQLDCPLLADPPGVRLPTPPPLPAGPRLPAVFAQECYWEMVKQRPDGSSQLHRDVSETVRRLGVTHTNELCVAVAGYHCDIAIGPDPASTRETPSVHTPDSEVITAELAPRSAALAALGSTIIEVNGPWHYYGGTRTAKPASVTKVRHLRRLGWHVLELPWWEWETLKTFRDKEAYLLAALGRLAATAPPAAPSAPTPVVLLARAAPGAVVFVLGQPRRPVPSAGAVGRHWDDDVGAGARAPAAPPPAAARASAAWDEGAIGSLVGRIVDRVRGISANKGTALLARATVLARGGRDLGAISADEWRCPGIGETLAQKVHEVAKGARPGGPLPA
ncbi:hypothetical protein T492DRAFT_1065766, partial [Pavlovales sp. CCMP2436]